MTERAAGNMISCIVIGRNEGWKLQRCLDSVVRALSPYEASEILYVDSMSTDGSLEVARAYPQVTVFRITGQYNAAIARNIGAREARGDVLFFVDGDMEIDAATLHMLYSEERGLLHDFVSGAWMDYNYATETGRTPVSRERVCRDEDHFDFRTGGLFLIQRALWDEVGGMRNKLRRNQDFDLSVRLAAKGVFLFRKREILAIHHTTSPRQNLAKMLSRTLSGASLYRVVSLRDNILNRYQWQYFFRTSYTAVILWVAMVLTALTGSLLPGAFYLAAAGLRSLLRGQRRPVVFFSSFAAMVWTDVLLLWGLLFFWPKGGELRYERVPAA